jgi:SAM-dependent methyltransferase
MAESVRPATGAKGPDANAVYALGSSPGESARLQRQAEDLAGDSAALLDRVDLRPGQAAIDLGCGPHGILDLLAGRVAPAGRVVGLDADPAHAAMAAEFAAGHGLRDVEIVTADARHTGLPTGSFDVVHARTLLINLPDPADVAAEMVRLVRPGGWVASMEPDTEHATAPTRGSAAGYRNSSARPDWRMSGWRPECRCTRPVTPAGPTASTWCAACARRWWRWG